MILTDHRIVGSTEAFWIFVFLNVIFRTKNCSTSWSSTESDQINGVMHGKVLPAMESWSWGELSGSNGAQGWSLTSAAWMLYSPSGYLQIWHVTKGTWWFWSTKDGQLKRGSSCLGVENVDKPGLKEAYSGKIAVSLMLLSCPHSRMCIFFVRLPVCLSETKEVQAGLGKMSPGCH